MAETPNQLEQFEVLEGYACYRFAGEFSLHHAVQLVSQAIADARKLHAPNLLVDAVQVTGFPLPSAVDQYYLIREWASQAKGGVNLALLLRPEMIDPEGFGATTAENINFHFQVFTSTSEAIAWLLSRQTNVSPPTP